MPQVGRGFVKPLQVVDQAALVDLPALLGSAIGVQKVIRVHKVRAHVVHVELGHGCQAHIGIVDHAARNNTWLLHNAIARHAKLLHVRQVGAILKIRTGNGLNSRNIGTDELARAGRKDIRRRHVNRAMSIGQDLVLKRDKFVERSDERLFVLPGLVVIQSAIVGIPERERLMVVAVKAQLTAHLQHHAAKIAELRGIGLARGLGLVDRVLVVFDHHAGIANAVFLRELLQIGPPDLGVKIRNGEAVVTLDISTIARWHGARKVIQIEHGAVDDRIGRGITQQADRRGVKTAHDLVIDTYIAYHGAPATAVIRPNERGARIASLSPLTRRLAQRNRKRRIKGVRELVALSPAQHKVLARHNAFGFYIVISGRFNAKLGGNHLQIARVIRRHGEHKRTAGTHPTHNVAQVRTEPIERRHEQNHAIKRRERWDRVRTVGGNINIAMGDLHVQQNLVELVFNVVDAILVRVGNDQARGLLAKDCRACRRSVAGGKHAQLVLSSAVLHAGTLHQQHGGHGNKDRPHHEEPHPTKAACTVADMLRHVHRASSPSRQNASCSRLAALKYTC